MKAISSLTQTKCEFGEMSGISVHFPKKKKPATPPHNWLDWPDFIILCKWTSCLFNYTRHLWIPLCSRGVSAQIKSYKRWVCRPKYCRARRQQASVPLVITSELQWRLCWSLRVLFCWCWIPISQLCTIDFVLMCKCNGLQANPIMES